MATHVRDPNFTIGEVKPEPTEFSIFTPNCRHFPFETDQKNAAVIKKEEYGALPMEEIKCETTGVTNDNDLLNYSSCDKKFEEERSKMFEVQKISNDDDIKTSNDLQLHATEKIHKTDIYESLKTNMRHIARNYMCEICTKHFTTKQSVSVHMKIHTGEKNFKCEICAKRFITNQKLSSHMPVHTGERNYKCDVCAKRFTAKSSLSSHTKTHTSERNYKCEICTKRFTTNSSLLTHNKTHVSERNHRCEICAKCFKTKSNLSSHLTIHTGERNYKCEICGKSFTAKNSLSTHMRIHTGERNYKCEVCRKRFITKGDLLKHMTMHTGEKNYKCKICEKRFGRKENLSNHMKLHSGGERNYKCEICAKCFRIRENLSNHMKMHTGERNYTCDVCTKRFVTKQHLSKHAKIHTRKGDVFLEYKKRHIEGSTKEESLRKIPYYVHSIGDNEQGLIKEGVAVCVKEEKLEIDNDTFENGLPTATNYGLINCGFVEEKPIATEIFDLWQTFSSEVIIKEEENVKANI